MEIIIKKGERGPLLTWALFVLMYLTNSLKGYFTLDMELWNYNKNELAHQIFAKRSYFSKSGAAVLIKADSKHVGRFTAYAAVIHKKELIYEEITTIYNDRSYHINIEKNYNSWVITVDNKSVEISIATSPIMTYNLTAKLNSSFESNRDIKIYYHEGDL